MNEETSIEPITDLLEGFIIPAEVTAAQTANLKDGPTPEQKEQVSSPTVHLFFSFDIVNSTQFKGLSPSWPLIIQSILTELPSQIRMRDPLRTSFLWRVIGDEMVFVLPIQSVDEIAPAIDEIFSLTQRITASLRNGTFYDHLNDQRLSEFDISMLKSQNTLSLKAAAWIAVINDQLKSPYDNISFNYSASPNNQEIREYLGKDIDAGFRLKDYTQDRRLAVSFELAYFLFKAGQQNNLHIIDYVRLKGVWNNQLYPIIWYYNENKASLDLNGKTVPFANSFRYDETDNNPLIQSYFSRGKKNEKKLITHRINAHEPILSNGIYTIKSALTKICNDRNLNEKIEYITQCCNKIFVLAPPSYLQPLELHCAVVCCNVQERTILITKRGKNHSTNPEKWEFGCAKAISDQPLINTIVQHYQKSLGVQIQLVLDDQRNECQPLPIAVYEINPSCPSKKGIIFVAKVMSIGSEFRPEKEHDSIAWISEEQLSSYKKEDTVPDFHQTAKTIFKNFNQYFPEGKNLSNVT